MSINIYTRDGQGLITFRGSEEWDSVQQASEYYVPRDYGYKPSISIEDLWGWPDANVIWHDNVGFAVQ